MILELSDLEKLKDSALKSFVDRMASVDPQICWEFDVEVARLESQLVQLYAFAAMAAKREETLEGTAEIWAAMVSICDAIAQTMSEFCKQHSASMASHDRILDLRNKCMRLQQLHA